jgi:hypothetical protein
MAAGNSHDDSSEYKLHGQDGGSTYNKYMKDYDKEQRLMYG